MKDSIIWLSCLCSISLFAIPLKQRLEEKKNTIEHIRQSKKKNTIAKAECDAGGCASCSSSCGSGGGFSCVSAK